LKCDDEDFIDFLKQCFIWEPEKRIAPEEALRHRWISESKQKMENKSRASIDLNFEVKARTENRRTEGSASKSTLNKTSVNTNVLKISVNKNSGSRDKLLRLKETLRLSLKKNSMEGSESGRVMPFSLFNKEGIKYPSTTKHQHS
jgi:dual specificity tyrosine-phosphorylation-regulated kinase 2/3/4